MQKKVTRLQNKESTLIIIAAMTQRNSQEDKQLPHFNQICKKTGTK